MWKFWGDYRWCREKWRAGERGNISETRKDRGKVTMNGPKELTNALSKGIIPDPLRYPLPQDWGFATPLKTAIENRAKTSAHRIDK